MTCPFSNARVPGVEDGGSVGGSGGGRVVGAAGGRMWERGTSIDTTSGGGSPVRQLGSVQERVSSYTRMTRSPSEPVVVRRKTSSSSTSSRRSGGDVRSRLKPQQEDGDDNTPLLTPARDSPDPNQPLSIHNLTEAVWCFITIPADQVLLSLDTLLRSGDLEWRALRRKLSIVAESVREWDDWHLDDLLTTLITQLEVDPEEFMRRLGREYVRECRRQYGKALQCLGYNLEGFLTNLTGLCDIIKTNANLRTKNDVPSLVCNRQGDKVVLHFFTNREPIRYFVGGVIEGVSQQIFSKDVRVSCDKCDTPNGDRTNHRFYFKYSTEEVCSESSGGVGGDSGGEGRTSAQNGQVEGTSAGGGEGEVPSHPKVINAASSNPKDSKISVSSFCKAFPWHFVCDRNMRITQLGSGLLQVFGDQPVRQKHEVTSCFTLTSPEGTSLTYEQVLLRINTAFVLAIKYQVSSRHKLKNMEFKGQMVDCPESDSILFVGSPLLDGLSALTSCGLFLSDISIHDATRDVILVGEQSRAQDGLKRRMAQLKDSIEETNNAVDKEREKNVSLLHLIFPPDIAKRLWLGEVIQAEKHDKVTMLFSDIVGFTSICATATPIMVINMLQDLYTQFDAFCGQLDVYKVETIGDAYCVAGNLHRRSSWHAHQVAWMALKMMYSCTSHTTHDGQPIQMRIGLHTGPVLAGVVGTAMPRYCMFGSNVTIANQFESTSEPLRIHISPTTHRILAATPGWSFTPRDRDCLPKNFPAEEPGIPWFLDAYYFGDLPSNTSLPDHIDAAMRALSLEPS
ncbi:head-specific guanylate cyclase-like [Portunus trituberculatus]|uniref:head-specific guanylate cyclase-like n=1 Tax=Portunus trituberculatus TaxID=210409 RepID=UPI001E1CE5ED|nr:head-specific guanylate cyclase-like [Portunus trituberculatus]XP_045104239.1 head-specific guanylate cyclase-like [Portunus trituberculatus]